MGTQPHQLIEQGIQQAEIGNWEVAKNSFQTALNIYRQIQDREGEGKTLGYLERQAMLKTMEKAPHPRNWAAFTLIGEAE